jgi:hypothetical protein
MGKELDHMDRKQTVMMVLLGLFAGIVGAYIMNQLSQKTMKAEQIVLVDKKGKIHAILGVTNIGKPALGLWDENGKNRVTVGFLRDGVPGVGLNDAQGNRRANLQLTVEGAPALVMFDEDGQRIWSVP